jgi:hypothetical protein
MASPPDSRTVSVKLTMHQARWQDEWQWDMSFVHHFFLGQLERCYNVSRACRLESPLSRANLE